MWITPRLCFLFLLVAASGFTVIALAQDTRGPVSAASYASTDSVRDLQEQVRALQAAVAEIRAEASRSQEETAALRHELAAAHAQISSERNADALAYDVSPAPSAPEGGTIADARSSLQKARPNDKDNEDERTTKLDEEYQLLAGKIDEQYQTKVESWSKYRVRFSGIVLFNLFNNQGAIDNADIPSLAFPSAPGASGGSFGATLRQSQLGFEVTGPRFAGARTSADVRLDFGGGFSNVPNGANYGLAWLRTGTVRLDWDHTSVVAGQDALFFSPLSPTSFASLSIPALAYAGNLWSWTPQIRVEHRFALSDASALLLQGGILDNLDGEPPLYSPYRAPQAGEASRQPAYATRVAWEHTIFGQPLTIGAAGYYGRQNYGFNRNVDGWAGMSDWSLPLGGKFTLSGKFYRGRAVGGLSGGIGTSVLTTGALSAPATEILALNSAGGWGQIKFKPRSTLEFNAAFGEDSPFAADVRSFPYSALSAYAGLIRNQGSLANVIFRPRSDLLFSAEYHYLKTFAVSNQNWTAGQVNLIMGILF